MSLHIAAKHLAAQGRGPDSQLVHMAPREVAGLQAIAKAHGGSLSINPETGLAEAGFLSRILPTVIGAGLAATGVGAPMAALMVGGGYGLASGDLKKGLMAGLGAYGGYGLADGAAAAAAPEAAPVEAVAPPPAAPTVSAADTGFTATPADPTMASMTPDQYAAQANNPFGGAQFEPRPGVTPDNYGQGLGINTSASLKPEVTGFDRVAQNFKADPKLGLAAAAPMMAAPQNTLPQEEHYTGPLSRYRMSENYSPYDQQQPNPYYQAQYKTYAGGGAIEQMSNANAVGANTGYPGADIQQGAYATPWQTPISRNMVSDSADTGVNQMTGEMNFAAGGHLGGYSDGGHMLKGPGDGMSDSIPAQIGEKQPARLADSEFVVPADVVSHLGNGSSDAGAKQLYKMMDRIRAARTGKKKQAPQVRAEKYLPA